jgi:hypothetical protein
MNAIDTTFATEAEEAEEDGSAEGLGRAAFRAGEFESDNPSWEFGLYPEEQSCRALEWQYGWQDEYDAAHATANPQTQHKAA